MVAPNLDIAVIYLVWLPYGTDHFKKFIDSYLLFDAGCPHQLVIVFNGMAVKHAAGPEVYLDYLQSKGLHADKCLYYPSGQDIEIYRQVAAQSGSAYLLFLNTYSRILGSQWLKCYVDNFDEQTGVIAASGSWQSYYSSVYQKHPAHWETGRDFLYNFRKYKLFLKAFFYWRFLFKPFPNPHIRTSAFMVKTQVFNEMKTGLINTKFAAYQFENGRKSLTNFFLSKKLNVLVVDKNGKTYGPSNWKNSKTFWIDNQENLLVADNQTALYEAANSKEKKEMTRLAWGTYE